MNISHLHLQGIFGTNGLILPYPCSNEIIYIPCCLETGCQHIDLCQVLLPNHGTKTHVGAKVGSG